MPGPPHSQLIQINSADAFEARGAPEDDTHPLRALSEVIPQLVWMANPDGAITWFNKRWYDYTGKTPDEMAGWGWQSVHHPDTLPEVIARWQRSLASGESFDMVFPLRSHDGTYRPFLTRVEPERDASGQIVRWFGTNTDISQQQEAERLLRESDERLQLALSAGRGIGAWDWDVVCDRVVADDRFALLYGVDPERAKAGAPIAEFFACMHPEDVERVQRRVDAALRTGQPFSEEYRLVQPDGAVRWVVAEGRCRLADDGSPLRFPGISFDITDRKAIEERLNELNLELERRVIERSQERGRTWHFSPDLMGALNGSGYFVTSNPAWKTTLGWTEDEVASMSIFELLHPDDVERTRLGFDLTQQGHPAIRFPNRYRCKHGGYRWISWVGVPDGDMVYCTGRDITEERAQAEDLQRVQETLRQSQKLEAIGQLTGGVAHDFNNVLAVVKTSIDLLRRVQLSDERRLRLMEAISNSVDRATKLTSQLLAFARRQSLQPVVFDVGQNILEVGEMISSLTGARVTVDVRLPEQACFVFADPSQFDTAIVNLAVNARDAMDSNGRLTITVAATNQLPLGPDHEQQIGSFIAVSVTDTGTGISPEQLGQIFEPFFTTKLPGQGTGLGLSQVFGFARQSGGDIQVHSALGKGSTFTLYLPSAPAPTSIAHSASMAGALPRGNGAWLLVVEDHPEVAVSVEQTLEELGYRVVLVNSGEAALVKLAVDAQKFAAVFSDVVMTGISGIELGEEIRARYSGLPIVLSSGYSYVLAMKGDHGFQLLPKPYSIDELAETLNEAIQRTPSSSSDRRVRNAPAATQLQPASGLSVEAARLQKIDALGIVGSDDDPVLDELTKLAASFCNTPIALISIVDSEKQWFKSRVGLDARQTPREQAFCAHAIQAADRVMVVTDATQDQRFSGNVLVTEDPRIRFYAGAPLVTSDGHALGTISVIDTEPRDPEPKHLEMLGFLARQVVERLEATKLKQS